MLSQPAQSCESLSLSSLCFDPASVYREEVTRAVVDLVAVCWRDYMLLKSLHCGKGSALPWTKGTTEFGLGFVEREKAISKQRLIY